MSRGVPSSGFPSMSTPPHLTLIRGAQSRHVDTETDESAAPIENHPDDTNPRARVNARGVFEETESFRGMRRFIVVASSGYLLKVVEQAEVTLRGRSDEEALFQELQNFLDLEDPIRESGAQ